MLRLVGGRADPPVRDVSDLPLGPWAGAAVEVWATKTGTRWHADPHCSALRSQARTVTWQQPESGTLGDRQLPENLHCGPRGPLGAYLASADRLAAFAAETDDAESRLKSDELPLNALPGEGWTFTAEQVDQLESGPLAELWRSELDRRWELVQALRTRLTPSGERMALMALASWVLSGRTPRTHQRRYDRFLSVAEKAFRDQDLTSELGERWFANNEALPTWLDHVARGHTCPNATRALVQREYEHATQWQSAPGAARPETVRDAWADIGLTWQHLLEGMALGHEGSVLALFHHYTSAVDPNLLDVVLTLGPAAKLPARHDTWIVAEVPAAFRLMLAQRDHGPGGLVLTDSRLGRFDSDRCALFLRNLVISLGCPALTEYVTSCPDDAQGFVHRHSHDHVEPDLPDNLQHFSDEAIGNGLTAGMCAPALQAALWEHELPQPKPKRKKRS